MDIHLAGRIMAGDSALDTDLRHLQVRAGAGGTFLYAGTGANGGLSVYRLSQNGQLASLTDTTHFTVSGVRIGPFDWVSLDGADRLVLNGTGAGGLVQYRARADGGLAPAALDDLPGTGAQTPGALASLALAGGRTALYMADIASGALTAWVSDGQGALTAQAPLSGPADAFDLTGMAMLDTAQAGGVDFLLTVDAGVRGVQSHHLNTVTGAVQAAGSLGAWDGLGISAPTAMETVTAHGATWVVLAAAGSHSLSVMRLSASGALSLADHLLDTLATRFGGVTALSVVRADSHAFVLAGGGDDGLSLFALLPDGRLVHLQSLAHAPGRGLMNVTAIEAVRMGDAIEVFVTSATSGISQFSIPLAGLGVVVDSPGGGGDGGGGGVARIAGTAAADLILAHAPQDHLLGMAGDDILVSGAGGGVLTGGTGADTFVLRPTTAALRITDFEPGADRLDMTAFAMLRGTGQLAMTPTADGIRVAYGTTVIAVSSRDASPLSAAQLFPAGLDTPDRVPIPAGPVVHVTYGTPGDDVVILDGGYDTVRALGGNDLIRAGDGINRVFAGAGRDEAHGGAALDLLFGEGGDDRLFGAGGDDRIYGGTGNDGLWGGDGVDLLSGEAGDDRLYGGAGRDTGRGGAGRDTLAGGPGADTLYGGTDPDTLTGGPGADTLRGEAGDDRLSGEADRDALYGAAGRDTLTGGGGDDYLYGGAGRDALWGGAGRDMIWGGPDDDRLYGGDHRDTLQGDNGNDALTGGGHDDRLYGGAGLDSFWGGGGRDMLWGGPGNDRMTGGPGADTFVFAAGHGADRITDFTPGADRIRIDLPNAGFGGLHIRAQGGDALVVTGGGTIALTGIAPARLDADDFLFS